MTIQLKLLRQLEDERLNDTSAEEVSYSREASNRYDSQITGSDISEINDGDAKDLFEGDILLTKFYFLHAC